MKAAPRPSEKKKTQRKPAQHKKPALQHHDLRESIQRVVLDKLTGLEEEIPFELEPFDPKVNWALDPNSLDFSTTLQFPYSPQVQVPLIRKSAYEEETEELKIREPFDPAKIRVSYKEFPIDLILKRIQRGELKLNPDFQRSAKIWDDQAQSRLIESLLIRIPIPVFYLDCSVDDEWIVVDGLQRLTTFKRFALDKSLRLKGLEFLTTLHGRTYDQLPKSLQRRLLESALGLYLIEQGTPERVKLSIFQRINTGGMPLSSQEIRHALYQGKATGLLNTLVKTKEFESATDHGIGDERMADRECILRALAFMRVNYTKYGKRDLDGFLNETMSALQQMSDTRIEEFKNRFVRSMDSCHVIFGKDAFRKTSRDKKNRNPINRSLFEVWTVCIDQLKDRQLETLRERRTSLKKGLTQLLETDSDFVASVTVGTGEVKKVQKRFSTIEKLIEGVLRD